MEPIPARLIHQAARLLDATPEEDSPILEVVFDDEADTIKIWDMIADNERIVATAEYEEN